MTTAPPGTLPRRLWGEAVQPTAEQFATWSRGVFLKDLVPVLDRLFDSARRGWRCFEMDHDRGMEELHHLHQQNARIHILLAKWVPVRLDPEGPAAEILRELVEAMRS